MTVFAFGLVVNGVVLYLLLSNVSLGSIAASRAVFTVTEVLQSRVFSLARLFSPTLQVGALGMLLFGAGVKKRFRLALLGLLAAMAVQAVFGGRGGTIRVVLAAIILFHHGVRPIRVRNLALAGFALFAGLAYIAINRFGQTSLGPAVFVLARGFLVSGNVHDAAFAMRAFPSEMNYFGGATILAGLTHVIPEFPVPGARNLWYELMDYYNSGVNVQSGIGGGNLALAAEHYMNLGIAGVVVFAGLFGLICGAVFEWQRRDTRNPFLLIFATQTVLTFLGGMESRAAQSIGGLAMSSLMPVGVLTVLAVRFTAEAKWMFFAGYAAVWSFLLYHFLGPSMWASLIRYGVFGLIALFYLLAIRSIRRGGRDLVALAGLSPEAEPDKPDGPPGGVADRTPAFTLPRP